MKNSQTAALNAIFSILLLILSPTTQVNAEENQTAVLADEAAYDRAAHLFVGTESINKLTEKLHHLSIKYKSQLPSLYCKQNFCRDFASIELHALTDALAEGAIPADRLLLIAMSLRQEKRYMKSLGNEFGLFLISRQANDSLKANPTKQRADFDWDFEVRSWEEDLLARVKSALSLGKNDGRLTYLIAGMSVAKSDSRWAEIRRDLHLNSDYDLSVFTSRGKEQHLNDPKVAADLVNIEPEISKYRSGRYVGAPRIYMFCRMNRQYPCMTVIKNKDGKLHRSQSGKLFAHPSLGYSRHEKEFNERNGNTPSGVFQIDSVMPEADKTLVFGKFRRMILNLIPASADEVNYKFLLPPSSHLSTWWKETVVARDVGRGAFRIHGTGLRSSSSNPFYPFVATSGCVAQRENKYEKTEFVDQRILLDEVMRAQGLEAKTENEPKIRGLLYVVNIDAKKAAVTIEDLQKYGIVTEK